MQFVDGEDVCLILGLTRLFIARMNDEVVYEGQQPGLLGDVPTGALQLLFHRQCPRTPGLLREV